MVIEKFNCVFHYPYINFFCIHIALSITFFFYTYVIINLGGSLFPVFHFKADNRQRCQK